MILSLHISNTNTNKNKNNQRFVNKITKLFISFLFKENYIEFYFGVKSNLKAYISFVYTLDKNKNTFILEMDFNRKDKFWNL